MDVVLAELVVAVLHVAISLIHDRKRMGAASVVAVFYASLYRCKEFAIDASFHDAQDRIATCALIDLNLVQGRIRFPHGLLFFLRLRHRHFPRS